MLFTFPLRYWFAIGLSVVFRLGGWCRQIRTGFLRPRPTQGSARRDRPYAYGAVTRYGRPFQTVLLNRSSATSRPYNPHRHARGFGLLRFRSPLLAESLLVFFSSPYLDVSVQGVRDVSSCLQHDRLTYSDTCGSTLVCNSPHIFAAYRVLRRLREPRHPPCALVPLPYLAQPIQARHARRRPSKGRRVARSAIQAPHASLQQPSIIKPSSFPPSLVNELPRLPSQPLADAPGIEPDNQNPKTRGRPKKTTPKPIPPTNRAAKVPPQNISQNHQPNFFSTKIPTTQPLPTKAGAKVETHKPTPNTNPKKIKKIKKEERCHERFSTWLYRLIYLYCLSE